MVEFILNDKLIRSDKPTGSLLLDFVRHDKALTGTKIGCREGDCGACTVLIGELVNDKMTYSQVTSCLTPIGNVRGKHVVTIEGLNMEDLSPVQQFMVDESGTQCGFCTVGFVVSLSGFCLANEIPEYEDAITAIDGNICRCTGYKSIERAARRLTSALSDKTLNNTVKWLVEQSFIPAYFEDIPSRLILINNAQSKLSNGAQTTTVGGGTDLYVERPDDLIVKDVSHTTAIPDFRNIEVVNGVCTIAGGATVSDLLNSKVFLDHFPQLWDHIKLISSSPIRNISTLAGNFVNASPIGDLTAFFLALRSTIKLSDGSQEREIFLKDLYLGYKDLDKNENEIIVAILFELPSIKHLFNFEKVSKRIHLDIASINTAAQFTLGDNALASAQVSAGGVAPIPLFLKETSLFLEGKEVSETTVKEANEILQEEISPISDVRGTSDYKRTLLRQLFYAHFLKLFPDKISLQGLK